MKLLANSLALATLVLTTMLVAPALLAAEAPSNEELYDIIQAQQEQLDALNNSDTSGDAATSIGGYGEMHYRNLDSGAGMDFHRFVIFLNHAFSDDIHFYSEVEIEHSLVGEGAEGEIELEQAYITFDLSDNSVIKTGLFLLPVGILNETHEPTTFYGVERNTVEHDIIPATWWEGGVAWSSHDDSGFSYDLALTSGLDIDPLTFNVRDGRQKVSEAAAEELAVTGRIQYTGIAGLELSASVFHQADMTQALGIDSGAGTLMEVHAVWNSGPFSARALYASWQFAGDIAQAQGKDTQDGYYLEGGYQFAPQWGTFLRYGVWDTGGLAAETAVSQTTAGINYWPHPNVVLKFDVQSQGKTGNNDGFSLGIGYAF